jgi:hypothetical protein
MILYDSDHKTRAENLAHVLKEPCGDVSTYLLSVQIPPCKDSTITIWGHGGPNTFANLAPSDLQKIIVNWKTKNPQLTQVELVTCDARHAEDDRDSYTDKLMPLLIVNAKSIVCIKSLPRGGSKATYSRLYAMDEVGSNGWYFVAGDTEGALEEGVQVMLDAYQQVPPATPVADRFMAAFPIAKAVNDKKAMKASLSYVSSCGSFSDLRVKLVAVTTYLKDGKIVAVPRA